MKLFVNLSNCTLVKMLLYVNQNYTQAENLYIINATIKYLVDSERWFISAVVYDEGIYDDLLFIDFFYPYCL